MIFALAPVHAVVAFTPNQARFLSLSGKGRVPCIGTGDGGPDVACPFNCRIFTWQIVAIPRKKAPGSACSVRSNG